ncbi:MAG: Uma2 family endonuclease [Candidatus Contendobacter sp.]|nr:Uma2 family endonuclease [Candidatus Contendobacter sp.]
MSNAALLDRDVVAATTATVETPELLTPHRYRLTVAEYHRLGENGIFDEDSRVELIEGDLIAMPPIGEQHASKTRRLNRLFSLQVGDTAIVDVQNPVMLDARSEPQPDMVLLKPRPDFYESAHPRPEDVLLLIEVSDSTLRYDRDTKIPLYARAGIPEVWLLDVAGQRLEIYRRPSPEGYREIHYPAPTDSIAPVLLPELSLSVASLFIPLPSTAA